MPRFTSPFHKSGSFADAPDWLIDEGRKLLGYLDQQRALSGIQTISQSRSYGGGYSVTASFFGNIAKVTYTVGSTSGEVEDESYMDGFVVSPPEIYIQPTNRFVVIQGISGTNAPASYFYDDTTAPSPPTDITVLYQKTDSNSEPLFQDGFLNSYTPPHADGLQYFGNIDWRNSDESLICTWIGPSARYFGISAQVLPYVFFHGQILFDCGVLADAGFFGDTSSYAASYAGRRGAVTGACIAQESGKFYLYVVVRFGAAAYGDAHRKEFLVKLDTVAADHRGDGQEMAAIWKLAPAVLPSTLDGNPAIVWSQDLDINTDDVYHPWFFNQSAAEARCIRYHGEFYQSGNMIECVLKIDDDRAHATYTEIARDATTVTTTQVEDPYNVISTYRLNRQTPQGGAVPTGTCTGGEITPLVPPTVSPSSTYYAPDNGGGTLTPDSRACFYGYGTTGKEQITSAATNPWLVVAVDYRDDVPVYAYWQVATQTQQSATAATGFDGSYQTYAYAISGSWGSDLHSNWTETTYLTSSISELLEMRGVTGGLKTDWTELNATSSRTRTFSGSGNGLTVESGTGTIYFNDCSSPYGTSTSSFTTNATYNSQGQISDAAVSQTLYVLYLDLRSKFLSYALSEASSQIAFQQAPFTQTTTQTSGSPAPTPLPTIPFTYTQSLVERTTYKVILADQELASSSSVTESIIPPPLSQPFVIAYLGGDSYTLSPSTTMTTWPWAGLASSQYLATYITGYNAGVISVGAVTVGNTTTCHEQSTAPVITTTIVHIGRPLPNSGPNPANTWAADDLVIGDGSTAFRLHRFSGSWQTYKNAWCFSQAMPINNPSIRNYVYKTSDNADLHNSTNTVGATSDYMAPIWVLPKVTY